MAGWLAALRGECFETVRGNKYWERRKWRWPLRRQGRERPSCELRARDRTDGTSAGETHVSRVVEGGRKSVEPQGYSGYRGPTEGAGTYAGGRTRFPATGCGARQSPARSADTNTPLSEVAVSYPGGQPANVASH